MILQCLAKSIKHDSGSLHIRGQGEDTVEHINGNKRALPLIPGFI